MNSAPTLADLEVATEDYRACYDRLNTLLERLQAEQETIVNRHIPAIRQATIRVKEAERHLRTLILDGRGLFVKPKTRISHGIEIGYRKQPDETRYPPVAALIITIKALLPEQSKVLVNTTEVLNKAAIKELDQDTLRQLGITISPGQDALVIKPIGGEVDRIMKALLGEKLTALEEEIA